MNYQKFNIQLHEHLQETLHLIQLETNQDPNVIQINDKINQLIKNNDDLELFTLIQEKEKRININMYYQGFNDAISLLTKSFK